MNEHFFGSAVCHLRRRWRGVAMVLFFSMLFDSGSRFARGQASDQSANFSKIENSIGIQLIELPAGEFEMGMLDEQQLKLQHKFSAYQREIHDYVEKPSFPVRLTNAFWISATETTVGQFEEFVRSTGYKTDADRAGGALVFHPDAKSRLEKISMKPAAGWQSPGFSQQSTHPVTCVSWNDAQAFCAWLSAKEQAVYRLPTEAEWEYACRAGTETPYCSGADPDSVYAYANVADVSLHAMYPEQVLRQRVAGLEEANADGFVFTAPHARFLPNAWGLYDMHGNVWEWCSDRYSDRIYKEYSKEAITSGSRSQPSPIENPHGPDTTPQHEHGDWRSLRGGSWYVSPMQCRSSVRAFAESHDAICYVGFRVVRESIDE
jgi:formylglycine-generating enzyme required for sulfatase activity